jgi:hypothetical protein
MNFFGWMLAGMVFGLQWAGSPVWAQKATPQKTTHPKPAQAQKSAAVSTPVSTTVPYLDRMLGLAKRDYALAELAYKAEVRKGKGYDPCLANRLSAEMKNAQWMSDHYGELAALSKRLGTLPREVSVEPIRVPAVSGQSTREISISLRTVLDLFQLYNDRLSSCSTADEKALCEQFNNPSRNLIRDANGIEVGVALDQAKDALNQKLKNLNATLKERNEGYRLRVDQSDTRLDLIYEITWLDEKNQSWELGVSLLNSKEGLDGSLQISEEQKWPAILERNIQLGGKPIQGLPRLLSFMIEEKGACEELDQWIRRVWWLYPDWLPNSLKLHESYPSVVEALKQAQKNWVKSQSACVQRLFLAFPGFNGDDYSWLCGETRNSPVQGYGSLEPYIRCVEGKLKAGERDGNVLTACKEECCK